MSAMGLFQLMSLFGVKSCRGTSRPRSQKFPALRVKLDIVFLQKVEHARIVKQFRNLAAAYVLFSRVHLRAECYEFECLLFRGF